MKRTNSLSDKMLKPESLCLKCCNTYDVYKNMKNDKDIKYELRKVALVWFSAAVPFKWLDVKL